MSSDSSNDVSIFVGILAGVAVMLVVGVIGLVGAGLFMFRASARAIPVPTAAASGTTPTVVVTDTMETPNAVTETPADEPVVAPVPMTINRDEPVIAPVPVTAD
ncbi:MAG: hypothetical protein HON53_20870 [Planctomycetaceae bacterium]|jgi:hypothetical protein|nr:hypothetical protein [Planctomycetaceae bacterium]MBT6155622.1 hypothetical protein [Planctomycetaceae bacterium]MBT6483794.1 hypothetical protein [Planctomycetaceae bacterium]MBT6496362.1 hypothetical protein [Planctomycetaceae bacterium]